MKAFNEYPCMALRAVAIFILLWSASAAASGAQLGDFVNPHSAEATAPENCGEIVMFASPSTDAPLLNRKREFNVYYLFACASTEPKRYVLWRTRHYEAKEQLVGELELPKSAQEALNRQSLGPVLGSCSDRRNPEDRINALVPYTYAAGEVVPSNEVIIAWKVLADKWRLVMVENGYLADCEA